jgi:AraC-like DNA-binding protein
MKQFRVPEYDLEMFEPWEAAHAFAAPSPIERPGNRAYKAAKGFRAPQCDSETFEQREAIHAFAERCQLLALVIGSDRTELKASLVQLCAEVPLLSSSSSKAILASILMSIIIKLASTRMIDPVQLAQLRHVTDLSQSSDELKTAFSALALELCQIDPIDASQHPSGERAGQDAGARGEQAKPPASATHASQGRALVSEPRVLAVLQTIEGDLGTSVSIEELAKRVGIGESRLRHLFRALVGTSLSQFRKQRRLETAAALLACSHKRISEIAYEVGFGDAAHFHKTFRRRFGASPTSYRKKHRLHLISTMSDLAGSERGELGRLEIG